MLSPFASMFTSHESPADIAYGKTKLEVRAAVFGMSKNTRNYGTAGRLEHPSEIDLLTSALLCRSVARAYAVATVHELYMTYRPINCSKEVTGKVVRISL